MDGPPERDAEFQKFLDKAKADKEAFMAQLKADEANFGQKIKGERAAAFKEMRTKMRADAEKLRAERGKRGGRGQFRGFGESRGPIGGDFGGGRLAGGGVRGTRGGRGGRGGAGGSVRGAR